jgi:hypothetical protein
MSLISIGKLIQSARAKSYALGYFESWNLDSLQGVLDAAESTRSPIIIGFNGDFLSRKGRLAEERLQWYAQIGRVAASNIGGAEILGLQYSTAATLERFVLGRAQQTLRPEMFARIDETLVFHPLVYEVQLEIAEKFVGLELNFLKAQGYELEANSTVLPFLVRKGFHPKLGARPMRNAVEKLIGDAVAKSLLSGGDGRGKLNVAEDGESLLIAGK